MRSIPTGSSRSAARWGGRACALARQRPLAALVLSAGFTGVGAYARRYLLPSLLVRHSFDNEGAVRAFRGPVLVQHGTRDRTIPFAHGERLAADGRLIRYECGHNDYPWGPMLEDVIAFLRERGILQQSDQHLSAQGWHTGCSVCAWGPHFRPGVPSGLRASHPAPEVTWR